MAQRTKRDDLYEAPLLLSQGDDAYNTFDDAMASGRMGTGAASGADSPDRCESPLNPLTAEFPDAPPATQAEVACAINPQDGTLDYQQLIDAVKHRIVLKAARRCAAVLLCLPFIGTIYIGVALRERRRRRVTLNPSDWMVLLWVGFCAQMSIFTPMLNIIASDASTVLADTLNTNADYLGPFIVFPACSVYLAATAIAFIAYSAKQRIDHFERPRDVLAMANGFGSGVAARDPLATFRSAAARATGFPSDGSSKSSTARRPSAQGDRRSRRQQRELLENIQLIKMQIQEDTQIPTWPVVLMSVGTGFVEMLTLRVCAWSGWTTATVYTAATPSPDPVINGTRSPVDHRMIPHEASCGDHVLTFQIPVFNTIYYHSATLYWMLTFSALTGLIYLALASYYQQLKQIERFTYISRGGGASNAAGRDGAGRQGGAPAGGVGRGGAGGGVAVPNNVSPLTAANRKSLDSSAAAKLARKLDKTKDLFSPKNLSIWISVWKELLRDLRTRPSMQAVTLTSVVSCIASAVSTVVYVIFDNLFQGSAVAEFTSGCISVFVFCACTLSGFLYITVRLERVINFQIQSISETQTYVQRQLETEMTEMLNKRLGGVALDGDDTSGVAGYLSPMQSHQSIADNTRFRMLRAKVNVLQALDTVLRTSESKPKLLGLSLETIRWTVIITGLMVMNAAFFVLYRTRCSPEGK